MNTGQAEDRCLRFDVITLIDQMIVTMDSTILNVEILRKQYADGMNGQMEVGHD